MIETCIEYCEPDKAFISSDERRWHTIIRKLAAEHPDECVVLKTPEENGGVIYAKFPPKWVRVKPPREVSISDERREILTKRLQNYRQIQTSESEEPS